MTSETRQAKIRRMHSLPPWETLTEPGDSEDAEDEADEHDELASVSSSHIAHSPASAASSSNTRSAASTLPNSRGTNTGVGVIRNFGPGSRPPFATPPSTQPAPASGSAPSSHGMMKRKMERLTKLVAPGKSQQGQSPDNSSRASGSGTASGAVSPNRETGAMPPPPNPSPSRDQVQSASRKGKERASAFSATQPVASSSRLARSSSTSAGASIYGPRIWTSIPSATAAVSDKNKNKSQQVTPQSDKQGGSRASISSPIRNSTSARTSSQTQPSSSAGRPSASQPQSRPRITNSLSAPGVTQVSKISDNRGSGKGKEKEIIDIDVSDDENMGSPRSQIPPRPKPWKKAPDSANKSLSTPSSSQRQSSHLRDLSTSSGDELPASLSQMMSRDQNWSPRKSSASISPVLNRAVEVEEESDSEPISSISRAERRYATTDGRRNGLPFSASRDRLDKVKASSRGTNRASASTSRDRNEKGMRVPPSTQPTSSGSNRAGPIPPPSSTYSSMAVARPRPKSKTSTSAVPTGSLSSRKTEFLGMIVLSDEDEARPVNDGDVIDLTLDDDGNASLTPSTSSVQTGSPPKNEASNAAASTPHAQRAPGSTNRGSPPTVRPKPRVSAVPKEKMASPKPQPADSRPLDVSRRRSSTNGGELDNDNAPGAHTSIREDLPAEVPAFVPVPDTSLVGPQEEEPNFDTSVEVMDTAYMDLDDPESPAEIAPSGNNAASLIDIEMQSENNESSPEQLVPRDNEKKPEETIAPIERARELRSPPATVQNKETQSQAEDANEVDLLLTSSPACTDAPGLDQPVHKAQVDDTENAQQPQSLMSTSSEKKSETLTDKLGMLDLSRSTLADGRKSHGDSDVSMSDMTRADSVEPPSAPQVARTAQLQGISNTAGLPGITTDEMTSTKVESKGHPMTRTAVPSTSTASSSPEPPRVSSKVSEKTPAFTRAVSPGALVAPPPTPGFMGFMGSSKNKRVKPSPAKDKKPTTAGGKAGSKQGETPEGMEMVSDKMNGSEAVELNPIGPVSEAVEPQILAELPFTEHRKSLTPPATSDNGSLQLDGSLSPLSRARLRIPEVRPPRKLNIPTLMPISQPRVEEGAGKSESSEAVSPAAPKESSVSHKEPDGSTGTSMTPPSEALASSRKLAKLYPDLLDSARSGSQKAMIRPSEKVRSSMAKPDSISYLKRRVIEAAFTSSSISRSPSNEVSTSSGQSDSGIASRLASPKRLKSSHSITEQDIKAPVSNTSVRRTSASSDEVAAAFDVKDSCDLERADEPTAPHREKGPSVTAAPNTRFPVARKSTPRRRPKVGASTCAPSIRSIEKSKESRASSSASQSHFRKRAMSNSSNRSDGAHTTVKRKGSASKRARIASSTDGEGSSNMGLRRSTRRSRRSSGQSPSRLDSDASGSSSDPMDIIDEPLDHDSEPSLDQPVTPVTDLAGAVGDIAIAIDSSRPDSREIGRYFLNRDRGAIWYHVRDIPTDLVNEVNDIPEWCKDPVLLRQMFEAAIIQNTTEDEPEAPLIQIINHVDEEATPPFEFHYTNRIYHGNGVPEPEYRNLKGCSCIGRCDPKSKTCACIIRQRKFFEQQDNNHQGFIYDEKGRVQIHEFPIFECNDACGCTEECSNRVVQLGRKCHVNIVKTKKKGWGVFAGRKIVSGTFIGIYSGEILLHEESIARGLVYNKVGKTYLFDIDFWYFSGTEGGKEVDPKYCMDAYHVGNFTRFLNHSCQPNCRINAVYINEANIDKPLLGIFAMEDINAGDELTFSYYGDLDDDDFKRLKGSGDQAYQKCFCGAPKCVGKLFTFSSAG